MVLVYLKEVSWVKQKLFCFGRSQAVRLPKEFRFDSDEVRIRRYGNSVVLEPIAKDWDWLDEFSGSLDIDFLTATMEETTEQVRPGLEKLFD